MDQADTPSAQVEVALLGGDLAQLREWGQVFRKVGIVPHIYGHLADFWKGVALAPPHLAMVDVRHMSQGERHLAQHPQVESGDLNLVFYCSPETVPLLYPAYEIVNLGIVWGGISLSGQIKNILLRFNQWNELKTRAHLWEKHGTSFEQKLSQAVQDTTSLKEKDFYHTLFKSLGKRCESFKEKCLDFEHACARTFESVPEIAQFTVLELNQSGQKLVCPPRDLAKYMALPPLWLGQTCRRGIEFFAQNMATQVCLELMGGELMPLKICGQRENPDKILVVRTTDTDFFHQFDWESLERYLSGIHAYFEGRKVPAVSEQGQLLSPWELMDFIGQAEGKTQKKWAIIDLHFARLVREALTSKNAPGPCGKFDWQTCFADFFQRLRTRHQLEFRLCIPHVEHALLMFERKEFDQAFARLEKFARNYPFWRYFADADAALGKTLNPKLQELPLSAKACLRYWESGDYLSPPPNKPRPMPTPTLSI